MTLAEIASIVAVAISLVTIYIAWKKVKPEVQTLDAGAASQYAELASRAGTREREYQNRIDEIQARLDIMEKRLETMEEKLREANLRAAKFEGWAKRLAHQVQALGGVPVLLDPLEVEKPN